MHEIAVALLLLLVANGAPILATRLLGNRYAHPLDGGQRLADGDFLFGPHKTWRGLVAAIVAAAAIAPLFELHIAIGALVGLAAMVGDAGSSFVKRRRHMGSGDRASVLDQLPEALLPLLVLLSAGHLDLFGVALALAAFLVGADLLSRLLFQLGIRERPY